MAKSPRPKKSQKRLPHKFLRLPLDLYNRLDAVAKANNRPTTWEGRDVIEKHVAAEEERLGLSR